MNAKSVQLVAELVRRSMRPPVRDHRFWLVQALVVAIAVGHELADVNNFLTPIGVPSFATVSLFLVPIVYAALNFGLPGSFATAVWVTVLTLPDFFVIERAQHHWMDGTQLAIIDAVAVFVGQRVERERLARQRSEEAGEAYRKAEARYRALFTASPVPILLVNSTGGVREWNPAARRLLPDLSQGRPLNELLGASYADLCEHPLDLIRVREPNGAFRDVHPLCTGIDAEEGRVIQVILQDVTEELQERERIAAYAAHVVQAQEEERRRIGQEIHDEPLQSLIQIFRRLASTRAADRDSLEHELAAAVDPLAHAIEDLRELARGLRPPALDDLGLVPALRRLVDDFRERNALEAELDVLGEVRRLSPELELSLFRIAQEALHNVERHAAARTVGVRLGFTSGMASIEVVDDGVGFEAKKASASRRSLGLIGMSERAHLLGGNLRIRSQPGQGTLLRAELPLTADAEIAG